MNPLKKLALYPIVLTTIIILVASCNWLVTAFSANKKADEINKEYENAESNGWYDENGNPLCIYQSRATVSEITVLD